MLSQAVLSGKAQKTYAALAVDECRNDETVKEAILKAYELVPEAYKKKNWGINKKMKLRFIWNSSGRRKPTLTDVIHQKWETITKS